MRIKTNKYIVDTRAVFGMLILFLCFGFMCGTDWRNYELLYESYNIEDGFWWQIMYYEPGYILYNALGNIIGLNFWPFFIITKTFTCAVVLYALKKYCPENTLYLSLIFLLSFWGYFMFIDNPMRNVIAVSITLFSVPYLFQGNFWKFFLVILIATLFHYTAILMLFTYFIVRKNYSNKKIIIAYILVNILFISSNLIYTIAAKLLFFIPVISLKIADYSTGGSSLSTGSGKIFSFGLLVHLIFFVLILRNRKKLELIPYGKVIFNYAILFSFIFRIGLTVLIFSRLQLYIAVFYSIAVCYALYAFTKGTRLLYSFYVLALSLFICYSTITADFRYLPYTNYVYYRLFMEELPFEKRDNYNPTHSPYKDRDVFDKK